MDYVEMLSRIKEDELRVQVHNNTEKDVLVKILMDEFGYDNGFECDWEGYPYVSTDDDSVVGWRRIDDHIIIDFKEFMEIKLDIASVESVSLAVDGLL